MNEWKRRSQSPSAIPRLLQKQKISASTESLSRSLSVSPVFRSPGSRIPTPQSDKRIYRGSSEPNLHKYKSPVDVNRSLNLHQNSMKSNENDIGLDFGEPLEELIIPSSPNSFNDDVIEKTFLDEVNFDLVGAQEHDDNDDSFGEFLKDSSNRIPEETVSSSIVNQAEDADCEKAKNKNETAQEKDEDKNAGKFKEESTQKDPKEKMSKQRSKAKGDNHSPVKKEYSPREKEKSQAKEKGNTLYITESLIKKLSKEENLQELKELDLSIVYKLYSRRIQFIENLGNLSNLHTLNVSRNHIQKIQHLDKLCTLQNLDLSHNSIRALDGLERLENLEVLNISHNEIHSFPQWFGKKLIALKHLDLTHNAIKKLEEVKKLSPLSNLTTVALNDNPISTIEHFFEFVVFHLRTISRLNGEEVFSHQRGKADKRFSLSLVEKKDQEIRSLKSQISDLTDSKRELLTENEGLMTYKKKNQEKLQSLKHLSATQKEELDTKTKLLDSKTKELGATCEKQYRLEQELTFYKLGAKFNEMWHMGAEREDGQGSTEDQGYLESAYIGKARYHPNSIAKEDIILNEEQSLRFANFITRLNQEEIKRNGKVVEAVKETFGGDALLSNGEASEFNKNQLLEKISKAEEEKNDLLFRYNDLNSLLKDANRELNTCYNTIKDLELKISEGENAQKKIEELEKDLNEHQRNTEAVSLKNHQVVEQNERLQRHYQELISINQEDQTKIDDLQAKLKSCKNKLEELPLLQTSVKELESKNKKLERQLKRVLDETKDKDIVQDKYNALMSECKELRNDLQDKNKEHGQTFDFLKSLTNDILRGEYYLQEPNSVENKPIRGALENLRNAVATQTKLSTEYKKKLRDLQSESNKIIQVNTDLEEENCKQKEDINMLKERLDTKESTERMKSHELSVLKKQTQERESANIRTIKEYDEIANEMRIHLEKLEGEQKRLNEDLDQKNLQVLKLAQEVKERKSVEEEFQEQEEKLKMRCRELEEQLRNSDDVNKDLKASLDAANEKVLTLKEDKKALEEQHHENIIKKDQMHEEEIGTMLDELCLTKSYVESLKDDVNASVNFTKAQVKILTQNVNDMEEVLQATSIDRQNLKGLKNQMKNVKEKLHTLTEDFHVKESLKDLYSDLSTRVNDLESRLNSRQNKDRKATMITNRKLRESLRKIDNVKELLEEKQAELNSSNVPYNLIAMQQKEIAGLLKELEEKKKAIHQLQKKQENEAAFKGEEFPSDFEEKVDEKQYQQSSSQHQQNHNQHSEHHQKQYKQFHHHSQQPQQKNNREEQQPQSSDSQHDLTIHHKHYFNSNSNLISTPAISLQTVYSPSQTDTTFNDKKETELLNGQVLRLMKGRDDLRWELSRLEAKVGDAVLHRSFRRRSLHNR